MNTATGIILFAGTMTFANEWYQTKAVKWQIPVATLLLAAGFDGLSAIDSGIATTLAVMVLIGAAVTKFNGKSAADTLAGVFSKTNKSTATPTH